MNHYTQIISSIDFRRYLMRKNSFLITFASISPIRIYSCYKKIYFIKYEILCYRMG